MSLFYAFYTTSTSCWKCIGTSELAVPLADVLAKLASALNTTTDFLMHDSADDKASAQINDNALLSLFRSVEKMSTEYKTCIKTMIDALVTKRQLRQIEQ